MKDQKSRSLLPPRVIRWLLLALVVFAGSFQVVARAGVELCQPLLEQLSKTGKVKAVDLVNYSQKFAHENNLPVQVLEVGPMGNKVKRSFIGIDMTDPVMMQKYRDHFNFHTKVSANVEGVLPIEFAADNPNYVTGVFRPGAQTTDKIYRWGREDLDYASWWTDWMGGGGWGGRTDPKRAIWGYGHIIPVSKPELENVKTFLAKPELRGKCKSDNCVAWISSIELGKTAADATDAERRYLLSTLGVSRSSAHFEIGRRLMNAADDDHAVVTVFYNGPEGRAAFDHNLLAHLPPDPQIPYASIVKRLANAPQSEANKVIAATIPDGGRVFFPIAAGASADAFHELTQLAPNMKNGLDVHVLVNGFAESDIQKAVADPNNKLRLHALFLGSNLRKAAAAGKVNVIPGYLGDFPKFFKNPEMPEFKYDAVVVKVSPPDAKGVCSLGPNNDMVMDLIRAQPKIKIIAEINPNVPVTAGKNKIAFKKFAASFTSTTALVSSPRVPLTDVEKSIGKNLAQLIDSDSTLQMGIGNLFDGLPEAMKDAGRTNVKLHTEMLGNAGMDMVKNGVSPGGTTGFAFGSPELYKWLDKNESIVFDTTAKVNNPATAMKIKKFTAVNTALQVSLFGDVNATHGVGGLRVSSPGGQVEFMQAGAKSPGGKSIIAIRSTAKEGTISAISMDLYGGNVTTPREMVGNVVTEFGVAKLAGKSEKDRAIALINVAHPKFRRELYEQAKAKNLLTAADEAAIQFAVP